MPTQQEIVEAVVRQIQTKDLSQQAVMVLQRATDRVLTRIKQNVDAQIKEDSSPVVEEFVLNVANKLSSMTQQWANGVSNDLVIFPEGTRYIWRDGSSTTIVVEQAPQVRHLKFGNNDTGVVHMLALPYVQFIIPFYNHQPTRKLFIGCTKKSISDLDHPICHLPLPNVNDHLVCTGNVEWLENGNITDYVNNIIGNFWQSTFTSDHNAQFLTFIKDNNLGRNASNVISSVPKEWANKSKIDPLFIVSRETKLKPGATIRRFLTSNSGDANASTSIVNKLKQEILSAVGTIGGDIQHLLVDLDLKSENREKTHIETLQAVLKEIVVQAYSELWEYLQKQLQDERSKLQKEMQEAAQQLKKDFVSYMDQKKKKWS